MIVVKVPLGHFLEGNEFPACRVAAYPGVEIYQVKLICYLADESALVPDFSPTGPVLKGEEVVTDERGGPFSFLLHVLGY